jgi:hypothetical protein
MVRAEQWYDGRPALGLRNYIDDFSSIMISFPTIRQIRVEDGISFFVCLLFFINILSNQR